MDCFSWRSSVSQTLCQDSEGNQDLPSKRLQSPARGQVLNKQLERKLCAGTMHHAGNCQEPSGTEALFLEEVASKIPSSDSPHQTVCLGNIGAPVKPFQLGSQGLLGSDTLWALLPEVFTCWVNPDQKAYSFMDMDSHKAALFLV